MQIDIQNPIDEETAAAIVAALGALMQASHPAAPLRVLRQPVWARAGILEQHQAQAALQEQLYAQHNGSNRSQRES